MSVRGLRISPRRLVRLIQAEIKATGGQLALYTSAHHDYRIEESFDREGYGLAGDKIHDLVIDEATLSIEPRVEHNYWVLSVVARRELGPRIIRPEKAISFEPLSVDEFYAKFIEPGTYQIAVQLAADTQEARRHFDSWWSELKTRHRQYERSAAPRSADVTRRGVRRTARRA